MKTMKSTRIARILVVAMVICVLASTMLSTLTFAAANDAITKCNDGVLQVKLNYSPDVGDAQPIGTGTGFLINENTLLTCFHVVSIDVEDLALLAESEGKTPAEVESRLSVSVTVTRDLTIPATILHKSEEMDFAIVQLSMPLTGKTPLPIRSSATVQQTEQVYSLGFPSLPYGLQTYSTFTSEDVTITSGVVNKVAVGTNLVSGANTEYIQSSCNLDYGNSGGPMLDANGNVIGISQSGITSDEVATNYYHAITIDQVVQALNPLGISYQTADAAPVPTEPDPTEPPAEATDPVEEVTDAPTEAPTLPTLDTADDKNVDDEKDDKKEEDDGNLMLWIIIGVVAFIIIVIIVVVIIIVASSGKKKTPPTGGSGTFTPPAPPAPPVRPVPPAPGGFAPAQTVPAQGAGETTVLTGGAGETTVLSRNAVNGGTLTRKRNGETISINAEQFVIGRERKSVNYCISDNNSISRTHVRLNVRNGVTYLTDLNAANGTFVNGVKAMPRQEIALKSGDKITLADEDLEYKI